MPLDAPGGATSTKSAVEDIGREPRRAELVQATCVVGVVQQAV
jgi:hypothetical protein